MNITSKIAAVALTAGLAVAGLAAPANAADTSTTFALTGGALSISAPGTANLGSGGTGSASVSAQLGAVTVTDDRGTLLGAWTSSVTSTDFTAGLGSADEIIANANADYWSGVATAFTGTAVLLPGQPLVANKVTLAASRTPFSASGVVGNNSATWNPTVIVNVPSSAVAGTYSGTITHSIA